MVLELLEEGELQKLHKKWWFDKGECVVDDSKVRCISVRIAGDILIDQSINQSIFVYLFSYRPVYQARSSTTGRYKVEGCCRPRT